MEKTNHQLCVSDSNSPTFGITEIKFYTFIDYDDDNNRVH